MANATGSRGVRYSGWAAATAIAGAAVVAAFFCISRTVWPHFQSVPLDDSFIHFTFARNLAEGMGFSFSPGQSTPGSTAPLWTLLLALNYKLLGSMFLSAKTWSVLFFLLTLIYVFKITLLMTGDPRPSFCASLLTALAGRFAWGSFSGMEVPLFSALSLMALYAHVRGRRYIFENPACVVLAALAALSRPEGALLFGILWVDSAIRLIALPQPVGERSRRLAKMILPVLIFGVVVAPSVAFNFRLTGRLFPNTFYAKTALVSSLGMDTLLYASRLGWFLLDNPVLAPFFPIALFHVLSHPRSAGESGVFVIAAWSVLLPLLHAALTPVMVPHGRYDIPVIPLFVALSIYGLWLVGNRTRGPASRRRAFRRLAVLCAVAYGAFSLRFWAVEYGRDCRSIDTLDVAMARWVNENLPAGSTIAVDDVGAMGYMTDSAIVDLHGLVTPEVFEIFQERGLPETRGAFERTRLRDEALGHYLARSRPDALVVFPRWHPGLFGLRENMDELHRITYGGNTICAYDELVAYRMKWDENG